MAAHTIKQQWVKLNEMRAWIASRLCDGTDITDNALFDAQQAIGFAMLHLERAEYLASRSTANPTIYSDG
jgi:hypothetical protein